ncbi:hypothetical protein TUMSATVNIG1_59340 (plasmid) [Vibrio nigripulchritudo]|nr:hypothetical protein VNTUMSATTG_58860 [Vibrio nigripulchritudo]BDU35325.1 hypothetical protein TUMSATVNIG1_59340 [Vibrio nigripulchritudo]
MAISDKVQYIPHSVTSSASVFALYSSIQKTHCGELRKYTLEPILYTRGLTLIASTDKANLSGIGVLLKSPRE